MAKHHHARRGPTQQGSPAKLSAQRRICLSKEVPQGGSNSFVRVAACRKHTLRPKLLKAGAQATGGHAGAPTASIMAVKPPSPQGAERPACAHRHEVAVLVLRAPHTAVSTTSRSANRKEGAPIPVDDNGISNVVPAAARTKPWPLIAAAPIVSSTGRLGRSGWRRVFIAACIKEVRNAIARRPPAPLGRGQTTP